MNRGEAIKNYVDDCFKKPAFMAAFRYSFQPVSGPNEWPRFEEGVLLIGESKYRRLLGMPKLIRFKDREEPRKASKASQPLKALPRATLQIYGNYKQLDHNKRSCTT